MAILFGLYVNQKFLGTWWRPKTASQLPNKMHTPGLLHRTPNKAVIYSSQSRKVHKVCWQNSTRTAYRHYLPTGQTRKQSQVLCQLRTGICRFNSYLAKIQAVESVLKQAVCTLQYTWNEKRNLFGAHKLGMDAGVKTTSRRMCVCTIHTRAN